MNRDQLIEALAALDVGSRVGLVVTTPFRALRVNVVRRYARTLNLALDDGLGPVASLTAHTLVDAAGLLELLGSVEPEAAQAGVAA